MVFYSVFLETWTDGMFSQMPNLAMATVTSVLK